MNCWRKSYTSRCRRVIAIAKASRANCQRIKGEVSMITCVGVRGTFRDGQEDQKRPRRLRDGSGTGPRRGPVCSKVSSVGERLRVVVAGASRVCKQLVNPSRVAVLEVERRPSSTHLQY